MVLFIIVLCSDDDAGLDSFKAIGITFEEFGPVVVGFVEGGSPVTELGAASAVNDTVDPEGAVFDVGLWGRGFGSVFHGV